MIAICATVLLGLLVLCGTAAFIARTRDTSAPMVVGQRLTVVMTGPEETLHGVLVAEYQDRLLLADASLITATGKQPIPSERARVYKSRVSFIQEHALTES